MSRLSSRFFVLLSVFAVAFQSGAAPAAAKSQQRLETAAFANAVEGELIVSYHDGSRDLITYANNSLAALALRDLSTASGVAAVQPNFVYSAAALTNDPLLASQTHLEVIDAYGAWDKESGSNTVVVAVIDSGVDVAHEDLAGNIWTNPNETINGIDDDKNGYVDDVHGWDFLTDSNDVTPKWRRGTPENSIGIQHGTGVAGLIGAMGDNNVGVAGVSWNVQIMSLRVLNEFGLGNSDTVSSALQYAVRMGADIINLSLVGTDSDPLAVDALQKAHDQNIIVVAAAGNNGLNLNQERDYPVCYDEFGPATVIGVGAIDNNFNRPSFSNYGSDCVDIVAPGVKLFTTRHALPAFENEDKYAALFSGTSFAAPQVSGALALLKAKRPTLTPEQALHVLQQGSTRIDPNNHVVASGFDYALNAAGALQVLEDAEFIDTTEPIESAPPALTAPGEFLAYPRGPNNGSAYRYQFPGPILLTPVVFSQDALKDGMRVEREAKNRLLVSAWRPNSKFLWRYNVLTNELSQVLMIPLDNAQTVGHVAVGNVDFDQDPEIVVAAGPQSKPLVSVYSMNGSLKFQFQAYGDAVNGGLDVALLDTNGDDLLEIVTVPVSQTSGHIKVFDYTGLTLNEWQTYAPNFRLGATLSVIDINKDLKPEIVVGPGQGGGPHVKIFASDGSLEQEFFAGEVGESSGAIVDFVDIDNDHIQEYVISYHAGHQSIIRVYSVSGVLMAEHGVFDPKFTGAIGVTPL